MVTLPMVYLTVRLDAHVNDANGGHDDVVIDDGDYADALIADLTVHLCCCCSVLHC